MTEKHPPMLEGEINPKKNPWIKASKNSPPRDMLVLVETKDKIQHKAWLSKGRDVWVDEHHRELKAVKRWKYSF